MTTHALNFAQTQQARIPATESGHCIAEQACTSQSQLDNHHEHSVRSPTISLKSKLNDIRSTAVSNRFHGRVCAAAKTSMTPMSSCASLTLPIVFAAAIGVYAGGCHAFGDMIFRHGNPGHDFMSHLAGDVAIGTAVATPAALLLCLTGLANAMQSARNAPQSREQPVSAANVGTDQRSEPNTVVIGLSNAERELDSSANNESNRLQINSSTAISTITATLVATAASLSATLLSLPTAAIVGERILGKPDDNYEMNGDTALIGATILPTVIATIGIVSALIRDRL